MKKLSENIYTHRTALGLSQQELAERLNVSRQSVSKWEVGTAIPESDKLMALADLFDISLDRLMGRERPQEPVKQARRGISPQKLTGILLMGVSLITGPVWVLVLGPAVLYVLLPALTISFALIFTEKNAAFWSVQSVLWIANFLLMWGDYVLYRGLFENRFLSMPVMLAITVLTAALLHREAPKLQFPLWGIAGGWTAVLGAVLFAQYAVYHWGRGPWIEICFFLITPVLTVAMSGMAVQTCHWAKGYKIKSRR